METATSDVRAGPSGLSIHTTVSVAVHLAGNGHSTNGSSASETPKPETTKPGNATLLRPKGRRAKHTSRLLLVNQFQLGFPGIRAHAKENALSSSALEKGLQFSNRSLILLTKIYRMPTCSASLLQSLSRGEGRDSSHPRLYGDSHPMHTM